MVALLSLFTSESYLSAQEDKKPEVPKTSLSVQEQIDALKEGQQRMLKELVEIKALLLEKSGRSEVGTKLTTPSVITLNLHGEPFRGGSKAKVAIIEYSDFECSFCAKYVQDVFPKIDEEYLKPGKAKYFFRDLPAPEHPNALLAARAARCAEEQGKFWEMHDHLFANQSALSAPALEKYGRLLELDAEKFSECLSSDRYADAIRRVTIGASRAGIHGTPAFLIGALSDNGDVVRATKVLVGGESFDALKAAVDEVLAGLAKN